MNFTIDELIKSDTAKKKGINNNPGRDELNNLNRLIKEVLQPIRDKYGHPIYISSGYRSPELNKAVGGAKNSQHLSGQAADIYCKHSSKAYLFGLIKKMIDNSEIKVGQLIWEYGTVNEPNWIHVSLPYTKVNQVLWLYK